MSKQLRVIRDGWNCFTHQYLMVHGVPYLRQCAQHCSVYIPHERRRTPTTKTWPTALSFLCITRMPVLVWTDWSSQRCRWLAGFLCYRRVRANFIRQHRKEATRCTSNYEKHTIKCSGLWVQGTVLLNITKAVTPQVWKRRLSCVRHCKDTNLAKETQKLKGGRMRFCMILF